MALKIQYQHKRTASIYVSARITSSIPNVMGQGPGGRVRVKLGLYLGTSFTTLTANETTKVNEQLETGMKNDDTVGSRVHAWTMGNESERRDRAG